MQKMTEESETDSLIDDSSESEVHEPTEESTAPKYDFSTWNPKPPAGLQFMCLLPLHQKFDTKSYDQNKHIGKLKVSTCHRQQRLKEFKSGRTAIRNLSVGELLHSDVDPCAYDDKKRTALHFAAAQGNLEVGKILLDKGADPNHKDILGNTPLHLESQNYQYPSFSNQLLYSFNKSFSAVCTNHIPMVTLLLKAGTNISSADKHGRTPLSLAQSRLRLLQENQAYTSGKLKKEVSQIIEMLQEYLHLSGRHDITLELEKLCVQLNKTMTREEVDVVNSLLVNFTNLAIQQTDESR